MNGRTADQGNRVERDSRTNRLLALRPYRPRKTRTPSQKGSRAGEAPHIVRGARLAAGEWPAWQTCSRCQDVLGEARRLRGAGRLAADDATGNVPLQSG